MYIAFLLYCFVMELTCLYKVSFQFTHLFLLILHGRVNGPFRFSCDEVSWNCFAVVVQIRTSAASRCRSMRSRLNVRLSSVDLLVQRPHLSSTSAVRLRWKIWNRFLSLGWCIHCSFRYLWITRTTWQEGRPIMYLSVLRVSGRLLVWYLS